MYGLPYYRQAEVMLNNGIGFSRQDLCNYQIKSTDRLKTLYNFLKKKLINTSSKVINADETTLKVIETKKINAMFGSIARHFVITLSICTNIANHILKKM